MEDEVKIEEGPNVLSFFLNEKTKHGFFRVDSAAKYLCDLECPRGRRYFNVFFVGDTLSNICEKVVAISTKH